GIAILGILVFAFCTSFYAPSVNAMIQSLAPPRMRGMAAAMVLFVQTLAGVGAGPVVMGVLNDLFRPGWGVESIRPSMACVMIGTVVAPAALLLADGWAPSEYARAAGTASDQN